MDGELPERADVVVVGGGIAGASVLWHLSGLGIQAVLLERDQIAGGATAAAVGVLSPPLRQPFHETVHDLGSEVAREIWAFAGRSVRGLGQALREAEAAEEVELDLSGGWVLAEPHTLHEVRRSHDALVGAGFPVTWRTAGEVREWSRGRGFAGGINLEDGGSLDPAAAARVLVRTAVAAGSAVLEGVEVEAVTPGPGGGFLCRTREAAVACESVVYAAHVDASRFSSLAGEVVVPIRGQALTLELAEPFPAGGSFSTHWKLNTWRRSRRMDRQVHLGGWRHDAWDRAYRRADPAVDEALQKKLVGWFRSAFPDLGRADVVRRWSGIFGWTADYLPLVGPLPGSPHELVLAGFSGGGLPFAFESARAVAHLVAGRDPVEGVRHFHPGRFGGAGLA